MSPKPLTNYLLNPGLRPELLNVALLTKGNPYGQGFYIYILYHFTHEFFYGITHDFLFFKVLLIITVLSFMRETVAISLISLKTDYYFPSFAFSAATFSAASSNMSFEKISKITAYL